MEEFSSFGDGEVAKVQIAFLTLLMTKQEGNQQQRRSQAAGNCTRGSQISGILNSHKVPI